MPKLSVPPESLKLKLEPSKKVFVRDHFMVSPTVG